MRDPLAAALREGQNSLPGAVGLERGWTLTGCWPETPLSSERLPAVPDTGVSLRSSYNTAACFFERQELDQVLMVNIREKSPVLPAAGEERQGD